MLVKAEVDLFSQTVVMEMQVEAAGLDGEDQLDCQDKDVLFQVGEKQNKYVVETLEEEM